MNQIWCKDNAYFLHLQKKCTKLTISSIFSCVLMLHNTKTVTFMQNLQQQGWEFLQPLL